MKKRTKRIILVSVLVIILAVGYIYINKNNFEEADLSETKATEKTEITTEETTTVSGVQVEDNVPDEFGWGPIK